MSLPIDAPPAPPTAPADRVPWGWFEALSAVVVTVVVQVLGAVLLTVVVQVLAKAYFPRLLPLRGRSELWFEIATYQFLAHGVVLSAIFLLFLRFRVGPRSLGFRFPGWDVLARAAASVVPIFVGVALVSALFDTLLPGYHLHGNAQELLAGSSPNITVIEALIIALFAAVEAPLVEETLFRGILYQGLRTSFERVLPHRWAIFAAALTSGTTFGLLHFQPHTLPVLILLGVALAYVFQVTNSVYASAIVHAIFNFVAVVSTFHVSL